MQQNIYYPSKLLAPYVSHYIFFKSTQNVMNFSYQDFPRTGMDMIFTFKGDIQIKHDQGSSFSINNCDFVGMFNRPYQVSIDNGISALHVRFKPNGIYPLTRVPLKEVSDNHLSLVDLTNKSSIELYDRLGASSNHLEQIKLLESWLLPYYQGAFLHYRMDHGLGLIEQSNGLLTVKELSQQLNTNYKSLDRWFNKMVGVNPKTYIQMARFKNILTQLDQQKDPDWMQLVNDFGFHDQAHFIKTFKQFSGITPSSYLSLDA